MRRLAIALVLVLAACGGGGDDDGADAAADETPISVSTVVTTEVEAGETATAAAAASPPTTTVLGGTAAVPDATAEGPAPIPPGTYRYRQTGRTTAGPQTFDAPPEGTAVVDPPTAESTQTVHRYVDPGGSPADVHFLFSPQGIHLYETVIQMGPTTISCVFDPALMTPAWPPTVGATSASTGDCGSFTAEVATRIAGRTPVTIDGASYEAFVMETTTTTTGDVESTSTQVDHFVAELRLSVHTESTTEGSYQGFEFTSTSTADLVSALPE